MRIPCVLLLCASLAHAQQPATEVKFYPDILVAPKPAVDAPVVLANGGICAFVMPDGSKFTTEPEGIVSLTLKTTPYEVYAQFYAKPGYQWAKFDQKNTVVVTPIKSGKTTLIIFIGDKVFRKQLTVLDGVTPDPGPDPGPNPNPDPLPGDPLTAILKTAAAKDNDLASVQALAKIFSDVASDGNNPKYIKASIYIAAIKAAEVGKLAPTAIPTVRAAIGAELNRLLPKDERALDDGSRTLITTQLHRVALILGGIH